MLFHRLVLIYILVAGLIPPTCSVILENYHCGIGTATKLLSYVISMPCEREKLNNCCYEHDICYERNKHFYEYTLVTCESDFEHCIQSRYESSSWCAKLLRFTHSRMTKLFGGIYRLV